LPLIDFLKTLNLVDPKDLKIGFNETGNALRLTVGDKTYTGVIPVRPFPVSLPEFVILRDAQGVEICMIKDARKLDSQSRKSLESLLDKIYFIPKIVKIEGLETSGDEFEWETLTDRGPRKFRTRGRMSIIVMGNRIVITDTDDNVYEIEDFWKLDRKSQGEIDSTF